jgi:hypothetical protein
MTQAEFINISQNLKNGQQIGLLVNDMDKYITVTIHCFYYDNKGNCQVDIHTDTEIFYDKYYYHLKNINNDMYTYNFNFTEIKDIIPLDRILKLNKIKTKIIL